MDPSGLLSHPARLAGTRLLRLQSDERLVDLARAGHEAAFDAIVHRYRPALLRYCTRILGPERAEDAVQQALASAHTAMTSGDERQLNLRPWLYRIAHNAALNYLRGPARDEVELTDAEFAAAHTPEDQVAERERLESVLTAIAALPQSQRDALLLRELEGRSHEEIGRALGVSSGAARATLFRARAAVRTACSALTPTPLLLRFVELGDSSSHVAAKAVAGVLAGCAIVGGGAASTGVIGGTHRPGAATTAQTETSAPEREVKAERTTAVTTPAVAVVAADRAATSPAPVAALKPVHKPKPVKVQLPRPKHTAKSAPGVVPVDEDHDEHEDHSRDDASRVRDERRPQVAMRHGRGPDHADVDRGRGDSHKHGRGHDDHGRGHDDHGRGHDDHGEQPDEAAPSAASGTPTAPVQADDQQRGGHGHGRDNGRGDDGDQAIDGVSGRRDNAAAASDSENSRSSKEADK